MTTNRPNDTRYSFAALAAGLVGAAGVAGGLFLAGIAPPLAAVAGLAVGGFLAASIKFTDQWEKAVLLRLGRYRGLGGPGYFAIVPVLDRVAYTIDQRIRTAAFGA
jgi:regulator of protease activity HflC (stomatin/prohibitin superfamily)